MDKRVLISYDRYVRLLEKQNGEQATEDTVAPPPPKDTAEPLLQKETAEAFPQNIVESQTIVPPGVRVVQTGSERPTPGSHEQKEEKHRCEECDHTFNNRKNLLRHNKALHTGERPRCKACNIDFHDSSSLARHNKTYHGPLKAGSSDSSNLARIKWVSLY